MACKLIPTALQNEPVFLSVDDTTVPKFGKKFDAVSLLHDHACHTDKLYVNGHCFVNLTLSVPVLSPIEGPPDQSLPTWPSSAMPVVIRQCMNCRHCLAISQDARKNKERGFIWMISTCPGTWTA